MTDEFFCQHCLEATTAEDYPDVCPHCRVGFCKECGARLKVGARFCVGCGVISPVVRAGMYRSSSTAGAYAAMNWEWEGLLRQSDTFPVLRSKQIPKFGISRGWEKGEDMDAGLPAKTWLRKELWGESMAGEKVRELLPDEAQKLGYS